MTRRTPYKVFSQRGREASDGFFQIALQGGAWYYLGGEFCPTDEVPSWAIEMARKMTPEGKKLYGFIDPIDLPVEAEKEPSDDADKGEDNDPLDAQNSGNKRKRRAG